MESVSLKLESNLSKDIEKAMKKFRYSTKTELIREAIRDKLRELEKQETLRQIERLHGSSKRKTTDEDLHRAGEKAVRELEKKFGIK